MLNNPTTLSDWVTPHSIEWYEQLSALQRVYKYNWNSTITIPNGESVFDEEVMRLIKNKKVLDVGCGHGEFTKYCSSFARQIVGFDVTENFLEIANVNEKSNLSFLAGNTKHGMPFEKEEFECAYIRKGPTSAYSSLAEIVQKGGIILGLHPGDDFGKELPQIFPKLFEQSLGTPFLDKIELQLANNKYTTSKIDYIVSTEYLLSPLDVLKLRCFGQQTSVYDKLKEEDLEEVTKIFNENSTTNGLAVTNSFYIVRLIV